MRHLSTEKIYNSRYYDGYTGRFISADKIDTVYATPTSLTDKNLYAYCDNNPVMRRDDGGAFWDTIFDVVSLNSFKKVWSIPEHITSLQKIKKDN